LLVLGPRGLQYRYEMPTHTTPPMNSDNTSIVVTRTARLWAQGVNPTGDIQTTEPMITNIAVSAGSPRDTPYPPPEQPLIPHTLIAAMKKK